MMYQRPLQPGNGLGAVQAFSGVPPMTVNPAFGATSLGRFNTGDAMLTGLLGAAAGAGWGAYIGSFSGNTKKWAMYGGAGGGVAMGYSGGTCSELACVGPVALPILALVALVPVAALTEVIRSA